MARSNKYTSLNFNDIYDKKNPNSAATNTSTTTTTASSSFSSAHPNKSYSLSASSRLGHGGLLVLSRPSPKPVSLPTPSVAPHHVPDHVQPDSSPISLRPQGKTGTTSFPTLKRENKEARAPSSPSPSPKSEKFVPPHLRPEFVARHRASGPRPASFRPGSGHGHHGDGRPKSGGGYDRRMRGIAGGESDLVELNRPRSGGSHPSSSGWMEKRKN